MLAASAHHCCQPGPAHPPRCHWQWAPKEVPTVKFRVAIGTIPGFGIYGTRTVNTLTEQQRPARSESCRSGNHGPWQCRCRPGWAIVPVPGLNFDWWTLDVNRSLINRISASPCPVRVGPASEPLAASWWSGSVGGGSAMRVPRWQCGGCQYRGATRAITHGQSAPLGVLAAAAMALGLVRSVPDVASESESTRRPAPDRQGPWHHVGGAFAISRTPAHWH
jgi:hypothetical protein